MRLIRSYLLVCGLGLAIATPARSQASQEADATRLRAQAAAVRSDLRRLVVAQEAYFADHTRYAASLDALQLRASQGVTITLDRATDRGWSATARGTDAQVTCWIYVGDVPKPRPKALEGSPICEGVPASEGIAADSLQGMMDAMEPMFANMMETMFEGLVNVLSRPDVADRLAAFARNYYDALVRRGFTADEALRIVTAVGIPTQR